MPPKETTRDRRLEVDGVFDVPAARRLEAELERARVGEAVRVDLSRVREFHDFGIALLAQTLKHGTRARVELRGLRLHQLRLLRYFGVDPARFVPRALVGEPDDGRAEIGLCVRSPGALGT